MDLSGILFGLVETLSLPKNDVFLSSVEFEKLLHNARRDLDDLRTMSRRVNEVNFALMYISCPNPGLAANGMLLSPSFE